MTATRDAEGELTPSRLGKACMCLLCPSVFFGLYWYMQGNLFLWSTFPSEKAVGAHLLSVSNPLFAGNIGEGSGCDPGVYWAVRGYMIFTYVMSGLLVGCCVCAVLSH